MPLTAISLVELTGTFLNPDASPASGRLWFTPSMRLGTVDQSVLPTPIVVELDAAGEFTINLPATDDPQFGGDFTYDVLEQVAPTVRRFRMALPQVVGTVDYRELVPVEQDGSTPIWYPLTATPLGDLYLDLYTEEY